MAATLDRRSRRVVTGAFLFALVALTLHLVRFVARAIAAIGFPGELDYGEGIVWEQMRLMVAGRGYGSIDGLPAIVFHYPPVFHLSTAALSSALGLEALGVGRSISFASTLLIAILAGLVARKAVATEAPARTANLCGLIAGLAMSCFSPIEFWAPLMRVDMLSIAFSFAGLLAAMAALDRPRLIFASALLSVAAVFTKQISIVAPAAVFLTFLLIRPRLAWQLAAACMLLGLLVLGGLELATGGGFLRHILLYNVNRFDPWRLTAIPASILTHVLFAAVLAAGIAARVRRAWPHYRHAGGIAALRQRLEERRGDALFLLVLTYAALAGVMSLSISKSGSNVNYLIEAMAVFAILLGIVARDAANAAFGISGGSGKGLFAHPALFPLLIGVQAVMLTPPPEYNEQSPARVADLAALRSMIRANPRPVISDDIVLLIQAGKQVQWEPAIFAELARTGAWDERPFVARVRAGYFGFFITAGGRGSPVFDRRYNPAVAAAIDASYPVKRRLAGYTLHLPARAGR